MSENNYSKSRRDFLRKSLVSLPVTAIGGTTFISSIANAATAASAVYKPTYFIDQEWAFINAACDLLIPEDQYGAGAISAGVPEFIDRQMDSPYGRGELWYMKGPFKPDSIAEYGYQLSLTPRSLYRLGIADVNQWSQSNQQKNFAELDPTMQIQLLKDLESGNIELDKVPAKTFFSYLLKNSHEGYFADPQYGGNRHLTGWKMIGFPGARADFMNWIDHPNEVYPLPPVAISGERG